MKTKEEILKEFREKYGFFEFTTREDEYGHTSDYNSDNIYHDLEEALTKTREETIRECKNEDISDGYHTFKELYEFRKVYNAALFNEWFKAGKYNVHKSKRHFDGEECFGGGWFIVVADLPTGQISNHYEMKDWDLFKVMDTPTAIYQSDGHTPQDVLTRLIKLNDKS